MSTTAPDTKEKASQVHHADCNLCNVDPSLVVYEDDCWIVRHSVETNILGYVLLHSRRHVMDLSQVSDSEAAAYGVVLKRIMQAVHEVIDCQRIYTFSLGEAVPHYHLHMIPRTASMPKAYRARGVMQYPLIPAADKSLVQETVARLRRAIARR